jgi:putative endonuclease
MNSAGGWTGGAGGEVGNRIQNPESRIQNEAKKPPHESNAAQNTRVKGAFGEDAAVDYLESKGFTIITRNFRVKIGEIDCIARDRDGTLVFVEVKSSRSSVCGHPFSWITPFKQRTLAKVARWYLVKERIKSCACRFDAIAVCDGKIEHLKNAFLVA